MTSPSEPDKPFTGRKTIHVLKNDQHVEDLDLWPGDVVLHSDDFEVLGRVNKDGIFVALV